MFKILTISMVIFIIIESTSSQEDNCIQDDDGDCIESCPPGTMTYNPSCEEDAQSQRTCREPVARVIRVGCDYSRCDCPEPLLWDEDAELCVPMEKCTSP